MCFQEDSPQKRVHVEKTKEKDKKENMQQSLLDF